jgi:hypothetical protein
MKNTPLTYYTQPGSMTTPGTYAHLLDDLPTDVGALCKAVQGVMLHIFWAERYGVELTDERKTEVQLRRVDKQLARLLELDDHPLTQARPHSHKLVGNCRDFTVMMTAILRHQGVPARARCGFGTYFTPGRYEDHWVCEVWNAEQGRWVLVDAQLDRLMLDVLKPDFDPLDVPRDRFIVGGKAWQLCRSGQADPDAFGIFDMHGLWFVRGDLIRDFLAFNKVEILPWDGGWGHLTKLDYQAGDENADSDLMDRIAALTLAGDEAFAEIRALYKQDAGFHFPADG